MRVALAARARDALHEGLEAREPARVEAGGDGRAWGGGAGPEPVRGRAARRRPDAPSRRAPSTVSWSGRDAAGAEPALAALAPARAGSASRAPARRGLTSTKPSRRPTSPRPRRAPAAAPARPTRGRRSPRRRRRGRDLQPALVLAAPLLFGLLVAAVVGLDSVNIDPSSGARSPPAPCRAWPWPSPSGCWGR